MFRRRIAGLLIIFLLGASGLVGRLFQLSVTDHATYVALAAQQQNIQLTILPKRGDVWIENNATGTPSLLAESIETYAVAVTPVNVTKKAAYAQVLAAATGVNEQTLLTKLESNAEYLPPLKNNLSRQAVENLASQLNNVEKAADPSFTPVSVDFGVEQGTYINFIGGVYFIPEYSETYPEGQLASQVLGFVNSSGVGQYGFEGEYNSSLKGYAGTIDLETDSHGDLLQQTGGQPGQDGTSYVLSIDQNVQYTIEQDLAAEVTSSGASGGSVIVMDPKTGEIIALANNPTYDPNNYSAVTPDQLGDFSDEAVSGSWEPGSIFKNLVMAAALNEGDVTPDTSSTFDESVTVQGHKIETALRRAYGTETMTQVISNSDNVAMVWVANKLGNQKMYQYLQAFGLGQKTGIDLGGEIAGNVLPVDQWQDIDRATIAFGQGIAVTPIQILTAYAALANNGRMVQPHVVHATIDANGTQHVVQPTYGAQVVTPQTAQEILAMMQYTVNNADKEAGTPGYEVGGKTGTAQIPDPVNGGYIANAYNHSFVGVDTVDNPRFITLIKIDNPDVAKVGLYAEDTAVPLFKQINTFLLNYYQIPPSPSSTK